MVFVLFGCAVTWLAVKATTIVALHIMGAAALGGIGARSGWLAVSWCLGEFKKFILKNITKDPDVLLKKSYFVNTTNSFNECAGILHVLRKKKKTPGSFVELIIRPPKNNGKKVILEMPLKRQSWSFEIDVNGIKTMVELYLKYIPNLKKICVWANKGQCEYIKEALKEHNLSNLKNKKNN